jgi:hypothetical protein
MSVHRDSDFAGAPQPNTYRLRGAGLTLQWQPDARLGLSATWARRLGDNPNPTATGNDQDGSLQTDRFWLTARYTY